jgi:hypothetical protein
LTCCICVSAPKGANRGADKSALVATRSRAGMRCVGLCLTVLAHPRTRATVGGAQRLRLHPPLPLAAGTLARRRLVSILHPGRLLRRRLVSILHPGRPCAAGSSRSSTRVESGLGVGSCPRLALRAAWSPSSSPSCALRADRARAAGGATPHPSQFCSREPPPPPLVCPLRGAPLGLAAPPPPCTCAHASASASADRLSWATSRLQLGTNLAAELTGRVFGVVSPVRVPCAVCRATR